MFSLLLVFSRVNICNIYSRYINEDKIYSRFILVRSLLNIILIVSNF